MGVQRVLQVDLKMESFPEPLGSRWMAWQVEYPASRAATQEAETEIPLAQEDLAGIVPLAMVSDASSSSAPPLSRWRHTDHSKCEILRTDNKNFSLKFYTLNLSINIFMYSLQHV